MHACMYHSLYQPAKVYKIKHLHKIEVSQNDPSGCTFVLVCHFPVRSPEYKYHEEQWIQNIYILVMTNRLLCFLEMNCCSGV